MLVIEGLSRLILKDKDEGKIRGIKVSHFDYISHLLFIDNVLLFGIANFVEWQNFKIILDRFCLAFGMEVSTHKSCLYHSNIEEDLCSQVNIIFLSICNLFIMT